MIDFENADYLKLRPVSPASFEKMVVPLFVPGEQIVAAFQSIRDGIVFTNRRVIAINVQESPVRKKISPLCRIAKFNPFRSKPPVFSIWTVNWNYGSRVLAKSGLNLPGIPTSPEFAA